MKPLSDTSKSSASSSLAENKPEAEEAIQQSVYDIMIVDDAPANLQVLMNLLKSVGYKVRPIAKGQLVVKAATKSKPDLILLDINMPDMNGYQVCNALKADPELADIPIIFISALSQMEDKIKAFDEGGQDYITKPFQFSEVLTRVKTHLKISQLQKDLARKNQVLEANLIQLQKLEALRDSLVNMIVHDLRAPLTGIVGYLSLAEMFEDQVPAKLMQYIHIATENTEVLMGLINDLLDLHRFEQGDFPLHPEQVNCSKIIDESLRTLGALAEKALIKKEYPDTPVFVQADPQILKRVLTNLFSNALKYNPPDQALRIQLSVIVNKVRISIADQGRGIPEAYQKTIFDKFVQVEARQDNVQASSGLGLAFCQMAMQAHQGEITLESELGKGSTFSIILPISE